LASDNFPGFALRSNVAVKIHRKKLRRYASMTGERRSSSTIQIRKRRVTLCYSEVIRLIFDFLQ
jgi:hypothetical protein